MNKLLTTTALAATTLLTTPAFADWYDGRYYAHDHDTRGDYAQVLSSRPIYRQVQVSQPRQECWDERVAYREPRYYGPGPGTLIGGILGGVIGNQFGGGNGRAVATAAGAVIGASVGAQQDAYAYGRRGDVERVGYQQRCRTIDDVSYRNQVDGYDVTYRYHGHVYRTQLPYDPGDRLAVDVDVRPVRD